MPIGPVGGMPTLRVFFACTYRGRFLRHRRILLLQEATQPADVYDRPLWVSLCFATL